MAGRVRIFRVDRGPLIMAAVPLTSDIDEGLFAHGPCTHDLHGPIGRHTHTSLRALEDPQVPRSRVVGPDPCRTPDGVPADTLGHGPRHVCRSEALSSRRRLGEGRPACPIRPRITGLAMRPDAAPVRIPFIWLAAARLSTPAPRRCHTSGQALGRASGGWGAQAQS
jgi:hypothetical protein